MGRRLASALVLWLAVTAAVATSPVLAQAVRVPRGPGQPQRPPMPELPTVLQPQPQQPELPTVLHPQPQQPWQTSQAAGQPGAGDSGLAGDVGGAQATRPEASLEDLEAEALATDMRSWRWSDFEGLPVSDKLRRAHWP